MSRWIPITESLPDANLTVLIATDPAYHDEPVWFGYLDADGWKEVSGEPAFVTAWQDLPEPPQPDGAALSQPELSGETIEQREEVCEAWHALPDELRRDPRLTALYRALGGPRMDAPSEGSAS